MVQYVDLDDAVGLLKRAVIDVYMWEQGWTIRDEDYYIEVLDWVEKYVPVFHDTAKLCSRPDEWGFRGGEIYEIGDVPSANPEGRPAQDSRFVVGFDKIRDQIDTIVGPWYNLPDPALIGDVANAYGKVFDNLCCGSNEEIIGEGSLAPNMTRIWDELIGHVEEGGYYRPALSGRAVDAFKEYVRNLDRAIGGCGGIVQAIEKCVNAQQELWTVVPSNVFAIVSGIAGACEAIALQEHSDSGFGLKDIELILGAASYVPGPVGVAATGAGAVVTLIGSVESGDFRQTVEIESHMGAMDLLDGLLNSSFQGFGVNEMINTFERRTCASIAENIREIDVQRNMYNLAPGTIETVDGVIRHDEEKADNISRRLDSVGVELGNVADRLGGCATELDPMFCTTSQAYGSSLLARDSRVGIGRNGPTDDLVTLTGLLKSILTELSGEVLAGAVNFKAAMDALDWTNSETRSSLMVAAQSFGLADQGGIDSFDFHPWTAAGRIEAAERAVSEAAAGLLGLSEGSSGGSGATHGSPTHSYPNVDGRSTTRWREWPNGLDLRTDQPCDAEPNDRQADDEVVIRPQPDRR